MIFPPGMRFEPPVLQKTPIIIEVRNFKPSEHEPLIIDILQKAGLEDVRRLTDSSSAFRALFNKPTNEFWLEDSVELEEKLNSENPQWNFYIQEMPTATPMVNRS